MARSSKLLASAAALVLVLGISYASAQGAGSSGGLRYELEVSPPELYRGGSALLVIQVEGMSAASTKVESIRLGEGLSLESQATRPYVIRGGAKGVEVRLGFALLDSGALRIETLIIASAEGRVSLGPIILVAQEPSEADSGLPSRPLSWEWRAPAKARLYEAIEVRLARADGREAESGLIASFEAPEGAAIEGSGYLSWRLTPLVEGKLVLPDAELSPAPGSRGRRGEAFAASIMVAGAAPAARAPKAAPAQGAAKVARGADTAAPGPLSAKAEPKAAPAHGTIAAPNASPGAELAAQYKVMRRRLAFEREHREAAAAARELLSRLGIEGGEEGPLMDFLPPPKAFLFPAAALALAAALAAALRRLRGPGGRHMRRATRPVPAIVLALLAALSLALAGASALERRRTYAVAWTEELGSIPSPRAELRIKIRRGSTAELRQSSGDYSALRFADGVVAWAPSAEVFEY